MIFIRHSINQNGRNTFLPLRAVIYCLNKTSSIGMITVFVVLMNFIDMKTLSESSFNQFCIAKLRNMQLSQQPGDWAVVSFLEEKEIFC